MLHQPFLWIAGCRSMPLRKCMGGKTWTVRLEVASLRVRAVVLLGEGMKRAGPQRERDGGDSFLATADSIRQQHRTAFCALKHTRSSYKSSHLLCGHSGLSFDASSEVYEWGGGLGPCGWTGQGHHRRTGQVHEVFVVFGCRKHRLTLSSGCVLVHHNNIKCSVFSPYIYLQDYNIFDDSGEKTGRISVHYI